MNMRCDIDMIIFGVLSISPRTQAGQLTAYKTPSNCRSLSLPERMACINNISQGITKDHESECI